MQAELFSRLEVGGEEKDFGGTALGEGGGSGALLCGEDSGTFSFRESG